VSADRPSVRDVAKLARVSVGTASNALNGKPGVSADTRARVRDAATQLGYQLPATPRSSMGMLMKRDPDAKFAIDPFYSYVLLGAEQECQRQNLSLVYASTEVDKHNRIPAWPPMLNAQTLMGVMIVGPFLEATIDEIAQQIGPNVVLVDAQSRRQPFDSLFSDNLNGTYEAIKHLIEQGHRHIGLVGSIPDGYVSVRERRKGYKLALADHGIEEVYIEDSLLIRESVYEATLRLLRRAPQITALFACNDNVAVGAMNAASELGLRIPDDLSIIGFDNIDLAQETNPPLTTVHVDKTLMGILAVRYLLDRTENPDRSTLTTLVHTRLVIRDSVRSIAPRPRKSVQ
jgi:LacI family transcriptional regulator